MSKKIRNTGRACSGSIVFIILLFAAVSLARAQSPAMIVSEQEAVRMALGRQDVVSLLQATREGAQSDVIAAATWENPEFSYGHERSDSGPERMTENSYTLAQTFDVSGQRGLKRKAALQRLQSTDLEIFQWRLERAAEVRRVFYTLLYHQQLHDLFENWRSGMERTESIMRRLMEAGDISSYDLERLAREKALVEARERQEHAEHERLTQSLVALLGHPSAPGGDIAAAGSLLPGTPLPSLAQMLKQAEAHPGMQAMQSHIQAAALGKRLSERWRVPDITLEAGFKEKQGADEDTVFFGLSVPLPLFNRNDAEKLRAETELTRLQSALHLARTERAAQVTGLWRQAHDLAEAAQPLVADDACLALVNKADIAYRAGEIGVLELLDAYRNSFENRSQILSLMKEARLTRIELDLLAGESTDEI